MHLERVILCGGVPFPSRSKAEDPIRLHLLHGPDDERVNLHIAQLNASLCCNLPPVYHDLIEIAAYVYSADQALKRSGQDTDTFGGRWRWSLHFYIPVRSPEFWQRPEALNTACARMGSVSARGSAVRVRQELCLFSSIQEPQFSVLVVPSAGTPISPPSDLAADTVFLSIG